MPSLLDLTNYLAIKSIKTVVFVLLAILSLSCNDPQQNKSPIKKENLANKVFIPKEIAWDTLYFPPDYGMEILHKNFRLFYFYSDSMFLMFSGLNEFEQDSILCCVENVVLYQGKYSSADSLVTIEMHRVSKYRDEKFVDTLMMANTADTFIFNDVYYQKANNLMNESYIRMNKMITEISSPQ